MSLVLHAAPLVAHPAPLVRAMGNAGPHVTLLVAAPSRVESAASVIVSSGWSLVVPPGTEGRLTLPPALEDDVRLVNGPCGTLDADYVGFPVGAILQARRHDVQLPPGQPLLHCEVHVVLPPIGHPDSPVRLVAGRTKIGSAFAAGADVFAGHDVVLAPGEQQCVETGVILDFDSATTQVAVRSRSGLAAKHTVGVVVERQPSPEPGTPIQIWLENQSRAAVRFAAGERIAQLTSAPLDSRVPISDLVLHETAATLPVPDAQHAAARRVGGYGSSGMGA